MLRAGYGQHDKYVKSNTAMSDKFCRVVDLKTIPEEGCKVVYFQQKEVAIFRHAGEVYAVDNLCPHRQSPLSAGEVCEGILSCPWHGARFELATGHGLPGAHQADIGSYPVRVVDQSVELSACAD